MSPEYRATLDVEVAKFFYSTNTAFNVADHPQWKKLVGMLCPGYTPPSSKRVGNELLSEVANSQKKNMKNLLTGKEGTLVLDGWSNIHNQPVVATCLHVEDEIFMLDSHDTGSMTKSADKCKDLAQSSITRAKEEFGCKVTSIVTDNAKAMENMRKALQEDDPDLIVYGCSSHWLNLLGNDHSVSTITSRITSVQKVFRNQHKPNAWLLEKKGKKPILAGDTRWNSQLDMIQNFLNNRCIYQQIVQEQLSNEDFSFDNNIINTINDFNLAKNAMDLREQLLPIGIALDTCQGDSTHIADACHFWLEIDGNKDLNHQKTEKRVKQALTDAHLAAYLLHPQFRGEHLTVEQREKATKWICEKSPDFINTLIAFQAKSSPFPESFFATTTVKPVNWWKAALGCGADPAFCTLAVRLMSAPASSASIERIFSSFGLIHNKLRNRLGPRKAADLLLCYRMLNHKLPQDKIIAIEMNEISDEDDL